MDYSWYMHIRYELSHCPDMAWLIIITQLHAGSNVTRGIQEAPGSTVEFARNMEVCMP